MGGGTLIRAGIDLSPLVLTRAGTARYVSGLVAAGLRHAARFTWLECGRVYLEGFSDRVAA